MHLLLPLFLAVLACLSPLPTPLRALDNAACAEVTEIKFELFSVCLQCCGVVLVQAIRLLVLLSSCIFVGLVHVIFLWFHIIVMTVLAECTVAGCLLNRWFIINFVKQDLKP